MKIDEVQVQVEGQGQGHPAVVMIHGWPDTHRLWDGQVEALILHFRCVRFTLPGFNLALPRRAYSLDEVIATVKRVVEQTCPGERITLLMHDWGCLYGYQFALRHPDLVARVIGVDIGDAGSRAHLAGLSAKAKALMLAYQLWLALAWRFGGGLGDRMARWMAAQLRCPAPSEGIGAQMGYPYAVRWFGVKGGFGKLPVFEPPVPMLYIYGQRKPFMFHSQDWLDRLAARPGSRVLGLPTGHWVMLQRPREFNTALLDWLAPATAPA